jgi:tungstate transport system permease protein
LRFCLFRGRRLLVVLANAFFGLPPVVVGLVLYLALPRSGPLGFLQLLYTPAAMVIAQAILAAPIITALVYRASERAWARYGDELISDGATRLQAIPQILLIIRARVFANWLASREGQEAISAYRVNGERLFNPSADAPK